jgi:hypothetical protein
MKRLPSSALGLVLALAASAQATTIVRVEDLAALVEESRRAVLAEVLDVRYGFDERQLHSTWVRLRVEDPLYGHLPRRGEEIEIKIYGAPVPMPDGSRLFLDGTPVYRAGQRYLLLLLDDSAWGFTDTAGFDQGAFRIERGVDGRDLAESLASNRNIVGERGLGRWLAPADVEPRDRPLLDHVTGPVPYTVLRQAILRAKGLPDRVRP